MTSFRHPRHVLDELGIRARKGLSQNFLSQPRVAERIAAMGWWPEETPVVEIGGGTGVLTDAILERYHDVTVIELDRTLAPYLAAKYGDRSLPGETPDGLPGATDTGLPGENAGSLPGETDTSSPGTPEGDRGSLPGESEPALPGESRSGGLPGGANRVRVIEADARDVDFSTLAPGRPIGVFGNLPYGITTELLMKLIRERDALAGAVVMVQKEYAERLVAKPRTKAYGSLTVFAALHMRVRGKFTVGPGNFHPPPDVESAVLALEFVDPPEGLDVDFFEKVVRAAFSHRRKMMKSNLVAALGFDADRLTDALSSISGLATVRGEELTVADFVQLSRLLGERE